MGKSCHLARKEWLCCSTFNSEKEIAILWSNSSILNDDESTKTWVNFPKKETQRIHRLSTTNQTNSTRTGHLYNKWSAISWHHILSLIRLNFFKYPVRIWLSSLSVSLIIQKENCGRVLTFLIEAKDFDQLGACNQDFVAPAPYHMPIEVVSVTVREHPYEERTPSGVVSWTVEARQRCSDQQTKYPKVEQMITSKGQIMSSCKEIMILLFKSTSLQRDCNFVETFFNFERWRINKDQSQRSSTEKKQETETDSMN